MYWDFFVFGILLALVIVYFGFRNKAPAIVIIGSGLIFFLGSDVLTTGITVKSSLDTIIYTQSTLFIYLIGNLMFFGGFALLALAFVASFMTVKSAF